MKIADVYRNLKLAWNNGEQIITPCILGFPGIGKSEIVAKFCRDVIKGNLLDIRMSQHDNTDIKGIPNVVMEQKEKVLSWLPPDFLPVEGSKWEGTSGVLFFDELNRATPDVLQSVFEIVLDRRIGMRKILKNWFVVVAGNFGYQDGTDVYEFDLALKDRFWMMPIEEQPDLNGWLEWAKENNIHSSIINFLQENPRFLYTKEDGDDKRFITPRRWAKFSNLISTISKEEFVSTVSAIAPSFIYSASPMFSQFIATNVQISVEDIFENYDKVKKGLAKMERAEIYAMHDNIIDFIKAYKSKKGPKSKLDKYVENFGLFFKEHLNDDNKVVLIKKMITDQGLVNFFILPFLEKYPEFDNENSTLNNLLIGLF